MQNLLSWEDIKNYFSGQWIEIVDYEWDWSRSYPRRARVINSAAHRGALLSRSSAAGAVHDSVMLFVGGPEFLLEQEPTAVAL